MAAEAQEKETMLNEFIEHQKKAATEAGKAVEALVPVEFRKHSKAAMDESVEGFRVLFNGMIDDVKKNIDNVFDTIKGEEKPATPSKNKVRVELN